MRRLSLGFEAFASVLTVCLATLAITGAADHRLLVGGLVAAALAWSALPLMSHVALEWRQSPDEVSTADRLNGANVGVTHDATVTTLIRLGGEPLEVARTTILLAAEAGATAVLAVDADIDADVDPDLVALGVPIHTGATFADALASALDGIDTHAVLIVSARSVPRLDECRAAASRMTGSIAWAVGETDPFHRGGFVPASREIVDARLRASARARGLVLWEPDATLVRTDALRNHPIAPGRPWGSWLRSLVAEEWMGIEVDDALALRAVPVDAEAYWPDTVSRQWGRAADLAGAATSGPARNRFMALGLLARELFAYPLLVWAAAPLLVGGSGAFPFGWPSAVCVALAFAAATARWASLRIALGVGLHPIRDASATAHAIPGSLASLWAALTRRMPRSQLMLPSRPLVWAAMLLTIVTGFQLVDASGPRPSNTVIALSIGTLGLLWIYSMSALVQRSWERSSFRVPVDLPVLLAGAAVRAIDGSPTGLAVTGWPEALHHSIGTLIDVSIRLDDDSDLVVDARVTAHRKVGEREILGLTLELDDDARRRWVGELARAAETARHGVAGAASVASTRSLAPAATAPMTARARAGRLLDRVVVVFAGVASLAVVVALVLIVFGYRPLVIRSGSMSPTMSIGDVVLSQQVTASQLRPGDVATVPIVDAQGNMTLTHRVVAVTSTADGVRIDTKGDHNTTGESTVLAPDTPAGRAVATIPALGTPATAMRTSTAELGLGIAALALVIGTLLRNTGWARPVLRKLSAISQVRLSTRS